jgi:hypothetical protein
MKRWAVLFVGLFLYLIPSVGFTATTVLSSCDLTSVQTAINGASTSAAAYQDGDTIVCPRGSWTWGSQLFITGSGSPRAITLMGAGIDNTIITINSQDAITINGSNRGSTKSFRLTGFTFQMTAMNYPNNQVRGMLRAEGGTGFRIDHNKFLPVATVCDYGGGSSVLVFAYLPVVTGRPYGVIDHNEFRNLSSKSTYPVHIMIYPFGGGSSLNGNLAWEWTTRITPGQPNAGEYVLFVEDNIFEDQRASSCGAENLGIGPSSGMIYVDRWNNYTGVMMAEGHGFGSEAGIREYDINHNTIHGTPYYMAVSLRAGTGVFWANDFRSFTGSNPLWLVEYRLYTSGLGGITWANPRHENRTMNSGVVCTASSQEGGSPYPSETGRANWYPCTHQIGTGYHDQKDPFYIWGNLGMSSVLVNIDDQPALHSGDDYYFTSCAGSVPCTNGAKPGYGLGLQYPHPYVLPSGPDIIPNPFSFTDNVNVPLSYLTTSNTLSITGIDSATTISISGNGGQYQVNGGTWTSSPSSSFPVGGTVAVRQTSSSSYGTTVNTVLTIGGVSDTYSVTTIPSPPPVLTNTTPSSVPSGTTQSNITLTTDVNSTCKYSVNPNVAYASMSNTFSTTGTTSHSTSVGGTSVYTDNFNRANQNPLSTPWATAGTATNPMQISSNAISGTVNLARNASYYVGGTFTATQGSKLTVSGPGIGPGVRIQGGSQQGLYGYILRGSISTDPTGLGYLLLTKYAPTTSVINSTPNTVVANDILELRASGSTLTAYKNGSIISALTTTDTTYSTGYPGIYSWPNTVTGDNWEGSGSASLSDNNVYTFYVKCSSTGGGVNTNDFPISFFVRPVGPPQVNPSDLAVNVSLTYTFTWDAVSGASMYNLQIDDNSNFASPEVNVYPTTNSYLVTTLLPNKTYYWRVRAFK